MLHSKMSHNSVKILFIAAFFAMMSVYLFLLGLPKTINIILDEYIYIFVFLVLVIVASYYKRKTKGLEIIDFNRNNNLSIKTTLSIFLVFQVIDYIWEDGFIGMISQWFIYWIIGAIMVMLFEIINYWKNLKVRGLR